MILENGKIWLMDLTYDKLEEEIIKFGEKKFRAGQIWSWLYVKGVKSFDEMSNISKEVRQKLDQFYDISRLKISSDNLSKDGTRKWLVKLYDNREIEMVFIPEGDRGTLCISSQVGCILTCKFCHTGTQKFTRNLTIGEITGQYLLAKDLLNDWNKENEKRNITSIVYMGMGEPFFNYDNVKNSVEILNFTSGLNLSKRKITISTSGIVPQIKDFSHDIKTILAISLHATDDKIRSDVMPLNNKYNIKELMNSCIYYIKHNPNARITFEYVMLDGVNDSENQAYNLVKLVKKYKLPVLINIIPFNPWKNSIYIPSSRNKIMKFGNIIKKSGIKVTIRKTKGQDVMAACGQLKSQKGMD
jgi:23S rRNA (adenine2503-C2)-methyltransferase